MRWWLPLVLARFLVPVCLVICNDIMAYMFGFFFGRTQLISISPKKTWEVSMWAKCMLVYVYVCVCEERQKTERG